MFILVCNPNYAKNIQLVHMEMVRPLNWTEAEIEWFVRAFV